MLCGRVWCGISVCVCVLQCGVSVCVVVYGVVFVCVWCLCVMWCVGYVVSCGVFFLCVYCGVWVVECFVWYCEDCGFCVVWCGEWVVCMV